MTTRVLTITAAEVDPKADYSNTPPYPKFGPSVTTWHRLPRTPENIAKHAEALFAALRTIQRAEFKRDLPELGKPKCPCPSGIWSSDGRKILAAVNRQNRAKLARALEDEHKARTDRQVRAAYEAIMAGGPGANLMVRSFPK